MTPTFGTLSVSAGCIAWRNFAPAAHSAATLTPLGALHAEKHAKKTRLVTNLVVQNLTPYPLSTYTHFSPWQKPTTRTRDASTSHPLRFHFLRTQVLSTSSPTHGPWPPPRISGHALCSVVNRAMKSQSALSGLP